MKKKNIITICVVLALFLIGTACTLGVKIYDNSQRKKLAQNIEEACLDYMRNLDWTPDTKLENINFNEVSEPLINEYLTEHPIDSVTKLLRIHLHENLYHGNLYSVVSHIRYVQNDLEIVAIDAGKRWNTLRKSPFKSFVEKETTADKVLQLMIYYMYVVKDFNPSLDYKNRDLKNFIWLYYGDIYHIKNITELFPETFINYVEKNNKIAWECSDYAGLMESYENFKNNWPGKDEIEERMINSIKIRFEAFALNNEDYSEELEIEAERNSDKIIQGIKETFKTCYREKQLIEAYFESVKWDYFDDNVKALKIVLSDDFNYLDEHYEIVSKLLEENR